MLSAYSKLAEHDFLIGKYYQRTRRHQACVDRIKGLLKAYPEKVYQPKYYFILAEALMDLSQFKESCFYYSQLMERWPNSEFTSKAQEARTKFCKG
jgi:outer membrane protein assembly factor BamD (BamD/ComL family)